MAMSVKKSRSAIIVILAALLIGGLSSAAWTQQPRRTPTSDAEMKRALQRLSKQAREQQGVPPEAAAPAAQQPEPEVPAPAPAVPAVPASPTPAASPATRGVQLNFENADLYDFINQISSMLGLTPLVIDPEVKGSVNIHSSSPMSKDDIMPLFSVILKNNNAALIRQGEVYQIVPISSALKRGVEIIEHLPGSPEAKPAAQPAPAKPTSQLPPAPAPGGINTGGVFDNFRAMAAQSAAAKGKTPSTTAASSTGKGIDDTKNSRLATNVIRVEFVPVKDLIEPIKLFMTEGGVIMPYERLNMLILTDYTDSVSRIMQIIRMLDNSFLDPDLVELIKINNNASADVAEDLKKMFGTGAKDSATGVSFISLDRLNAIFVMASSKRALEEVKGWIKELDSSSAKNINTYVYTVENSTASQIAMMISALYGGEGTTTDTGTGTTTGTTGGGGLGGTRGSQGTGIFGSGGSGTAANSPSNQNQNTPFGSYNSGYSGGYNSGYSGGYTGGMFGGSPFSTGRQLGPSLNVSRSVSSQILRGGQFTGLQDTVRMVVDDVNNSLIIQATAADYAYISETIRKMDVLPRQALIDAKIFEVDLTDSMIFGVSGELRAKTEGSHLTTGKLGPTGLLTASTFIPVGDAREILLGLEALRMKTNVRILESPSVLALDGQMASIIVGAEYPYPGTTFTPSVGGSTTSVSYRDTGISLLVIPRISASGNVTMDIMQEVSAPAPGLELEDGSTAPAFNKASVQTTLSVKDGETVAIAGLIRDANDFSRNGIPFLSDIPVLGALFGQTNKSSRRSELIILITPHVIRTPEKLNEMTQELRDSLRNVRKFADEKEKEHAGDMEDARKDRYKQEQKNQKEYKAVKPEEPEKLEKPQ